MDLATIRRAFSYLRPYRLELWIGQLAMLLAPAAGLALPLCSRFLVDALTGFRSPGVVGTSVIAHRLSTAERLDRIYVMDEGRTLARGTHAELLGHCPLYARIWGNQILATRPGSGAYPALPDMV